MYAKVFSSLFQGSMRGQSDLILAFVNILTHANADGIADIHWRVISEETGMGEKRTRAAIKALESPDPESRTPDEEGRRIILLDPHRDWGWRIVNHLVYRDIAKGMHQRKLAAERQKKYRASQAVTDVTHNVRDVPLPPVVAVAVESESEVKGEGVEGGTSLTVLRRALCSMFNRSEQDRWSYAEETALAEVSRRPNCLLEFDEISQHRLRLPIADKKYFPRRIGSLLDNWTGNLDSARNFVASPELEAKRKQEERRIAREMQRAMQ